MTHTTRPQALFLSALASATVLVAAGGAWAADTVVQVPCDGVIDGRTVATFTGGQVVPWVAAQGVDGDGNADGYVTTAVEAELVKQGKTVGGQAGKALPDNGLFPMDARHPAIQLHFSNAADQASAQTKQLYIAKGMQSFQLPVPAATYSKMFLILTASEGAAALTITFNYAGGAQPVVTKLMLPDYGVGGAQANDKVFFNLIDGMRKWTSTLQEGDGPSHTITGIEMAPSATDQLTSIGIEKTNGSHVVFWGATGIATSPIEIGGSGGGGTGGAAGAGGTAAGAGGVAGAGGAGGSGGAIASGGTGGVAGGGTPSIAGTAGVTTGGGAGGAGGAPTVGTAGSSATGQSGSASLAGSSSVTTEPMSSESGGCGVARPRSGTAAQLGLLLALSLVARRRRTHRA